MANLWSQLRKDGISMSLDTAIFAGGCFWCMVKAKC